MNTQSWLLQITAGAGPIEVCRFVQLLAEKLEETCFMAGLHLHKKIICGEAACPHSIMMEIHGNADAILHSWIGTHALMAANPARGKKARKRWFAGVTLYPAQTEQQVSFKTEDITFQAIRSSGPGGQNVNKVASAVRAFHQPSGLSLRVHDQRSQEANRKIAQKRLKTKLEAQIALHMAQIQKKQRQSHHILQRGNAVRCWRIDSIHKKDKLSEDIRV